MLIDTHNGVKRWTTVGASPNIIEASWRTPPGEWTVTIYGQTEVTRDLMAGRDAGAGISVYEAANVMP